MAVKIYHGDILFTPSADRLEIHENSYIIVEDGVVSQICEKIPEQYQGAEVVDYGDKLIIPAFSDLHVHGAQYVQRGIGMGCLLSDWLNHYTFPQESRFQNMEYAKNCYDAFVDDMLRHGTFHANVFATIHREATNYLFDKMEEKGMYGYVGKVNMDCKSPEFLTETTEDSLKETEKYLAEHEGSKKVKTILVEDFAVSESDADEILKFIAIKGSNAEVLKALEGYTGRNEMFDQGLSELNTVVKYLADFGVPAENFAVDLTIARGLDYYTGTVYETTLLDHPEIGSVCSGGRYDNLAEFYTDKQLPGVGISIGLTRLFYVLGEQGMLNPELPTAPADVLILPMTEDLSPAIALATQLRQAGIRTQLHCEQKKFKAKMSYADKLSIPYVIFLGEDEISVGVVACKDMKSGEQTKLNTQETINRIKAGLAELEKGSVIVE